MLRFNCKRINLPHDITQVQVIEQRHVLRIGLTLSLLFGGSLLIWLSEFNRPIAAAPVGVTWPTISLTLAVSGLTQPTYIHHAGDGSGRIFIVERRGSIRIFKNNALQSTPFLDLSPTGANRVGSSGAEQGLLSVAFPPGYVTKGYFYVYYTNLSGTIVVARYRITANPDVADPNSEQIVLAINHPTYQNHNGGQLQFGPDGFLYIGVGDGGSGGDPNNNAQNPNVLLGKLLRINVEPISNPAPPPAPSFTPVFTFYLPITALSPNSPVIYTIPVTNPFTSTVGYRGEIWALGLRNPWRFSFDRQTHDLYIADVGQSSREEVDFQLAASAGGQNYGWRCYEGNIVYNPTGCGPIGQYTFPVVDYAHDVGCSITGGYVYRGPGNAAMQGIYFYGDFCSGTIWGLQMSGPTWVSSALKSTGISISTFGEDEPGNLYVANYFGGSIYQITSP